MNVLHLTVSRFGAFVAVLAVALAPVMASHAADVTPAKAASNNIRGKIAVHGFVINPADFVIRARPLPGESRTGNGLDKRLRPVIVRAERVAGGSPNEFKFKFADLEPGTPYRIGIKLDNQKNYPRLVWRANQDPLVLPGDSSLQFDAYAVRSDIEVYSEESDERAGWFACDALDFSDPGRASKSFRWRTGIADATGARLQISVKPFPRIGNARYNACDDGSGIIYSEDFGDIVPFEWTELPSIDFYALLTSGRALARSGKGLPRGVAGPALLAENWESETLPKLEAGLPLYVRVLPMIGEEIACDPDDYGVPPEAILAKILLALFEITPPVDTKVSLGNVWYTKPDYGARPYPGETCYRFIKDHKLKQPLTQGYTVWDSLAVSYMSGAQFGSTIKRNKTFCIPPASNSSSFIEDFFDAAGSVLTGAIDLLADAVNYTAKLWEEIQDAVVDVAADAITTAGIANCGEGSACRGALETGLEIGLATMGVPPSLPNFDDLINEGFDYIAAEVASQTGVPEEVVDYASEKAQKFVKDAAARMKTNYSVEGMPNWLAPDIRFNPAYLVVELYGPGKSEPFYYAPTLLRFSTPIYEQASMKLPEMLPLEGVEPPILFPIVLPPNLTGLTPPPNVTINMLGGQVTVPLPAYARSVWNKNQWIANRFLAPGSCYALQMYAISNHPAQGVLGDQGYFIFEANFSPVNAAACSP